MEALVSTVIELQGNAAADAQTLVALLQDKGVDLEPVERPDQDRDMGEVAIELGVAFLAQASAGIVHELVRGWLRDRGHRTEEGTVRPSHESPSDEDGSDEGGAQDRPEERP
ncbi:hypothetical protein [Polymorphospora rubra]|uniref:hypothetical protein n=1 Tax=Polymorphospora rubra TaxID=338584 RepID=UPI0033E3E2A6